MDSKVAHMDSLWAGRQWLVSLKSNFMGSGEREL